MEKGALIKALSGHGREVFDIDMSEDGKYSISAGFDGTTRLWDNVTGNELLKIQAHKGMYGKAKSVVFVKDGMHVFSGEARAKSNFGT